MCENANDYDTFIGYALEFLTVYNCCLIRNENEKVTQLYSFILFYFRSDFFYIKRNTLFIQSPRNTSSQTIFYCFNSLLIFYNVKGNINFDFNF